MGLCATKAAGTALPSRDGSVSVPDLPEEAGQTPTQGGPNVTTGVPPPINTNGLAGRRVADRTMTPASENLRGDGPQDADPLQKMFSRHANPIEAVKQGADAHGHVSYRYLPGYEPAAGSTPASGTGSEPVAGAESDALLKLFSRHADAVPEELRAPPGDGELIHLTRTEEAPVGHEQHASALANILGNASAPVQDGVIRPFNPHSNDQHAAYGVCLRTGDNGRDASELYADHEALGHRWVGPYLAHYPELAFLLEVQGEVMGYVLGCLDSEPFYDWAASTWCPARRSECPRPEGDPAQYNKDEEIYAFFHSPNYMPPPPELADYPCHLHIDIVEKAQRKGWGTKMIEKLLAAMAQRGGKGVHLEMWSPNTGAYKFYMRMGFEELLRTTGDYQPLAADQRAEPHIIFLGRRIANGIRRPPSPRGLSE